MAASKTYFSRNYQFISGDRDGEMSSDSPAFEFNESDVFNSSRPLSPEVCKPAPIVRVSKKASSKRVDRGTPASMPVNVPDWSKILKQEYRENRRGESDDDDLEDDELDGGGNRIPPHEYLARRTRVVSFSVHEGIGRTLKGRDLSRVRNAIWDKIGFQD